MKTLRLILLAMRSHWDAQISNPANLVAGTLGMVINNVIVLIGLWAMLFEGKPAEHELTLYFLALNALVTISWGAICFLAGGFRVLGEYIEQGTLEPMLATPRDPLLLAGLSQSNAPSLGDILQGSCNILALFIIGPTPFALRTIAFVGISTVGFLALFILAGSIPFFLTRGSAFSAFFIECNLSLSFYPTGKIFTDRARLILYLLPAVATGVLPMSAVESGSWKAMVTSVAVAFAFLWIAVRVFRLGLKRYQSSSYVTLRA